MFDPGNSGQNKPRGAMGCALIALGLLILLPSGLCTAIFGIVMITEGAGNDLEGLNLLIVFFVIALIGAALVYAGVQARKKG